MTSAIRWTVQSNSTNSDARTLSIQLDTVHALAACNAGVYAAAIKRW